MNSYWVLSFEMGILHDLLLIFWSVVITRRFRKTIIQVVRLKDYALADWFFNSLNSILDTVYPVVDGYVASRGRKPIDHRFQLRFLIWHKLFGRPELSNSIIEFNNNDKLRKALHSPVESLSLSVVDRFVLRVGEAGFKEILALLVTECVKRGILTGKHLVMDGFPIHSLLNTAKCLKLPDWSNERFVDFFGQLGLEEIIEELPVLHGRCNPALDKIKTLLVELLWSFPSDTTIHKFLFGTRGLAITLGYIKPMKTVMTWKKFIQAFLSQSEYEYARQLLLAQLRQIPEIQAILPTNWIPTTLIDLKGIFSNTHAAKDPGSRLNYCAAKNETYWGREGVIIADQPTGLALGITIQSSSKITGAQAVKVLQSFTSRHTEEIKVETVTMDREFDNHVVHRYLKRELCVKDQVLRKNASAKQYKKQKPWQRLRLAVERCIAFLTLHFNIEFPRCRGDERVRCWTQLCGICQILVALALYNRGFRSGYNRIRSIRG